MAKVYCATGTKLNRKVATRVFPESFGILRARSRRMTRFTREAQLLASLNRPNIAAIHITRGPVLFVDGSDSNRAIRVRRGCSQDGESRIADAHA